MRTYHHTPVLSDKVTELLITDTDGVYIDCTLGGGGHSQAILHHISDKGRVIGIDQDEDAINAARKNLKRFSKRISFIKANFSQLKDVLPSDVRYSGFLFDLGVSSYQIDYGNRGFSFQSDGPLDMRMDTTNPLTAKSVVNNRSFEELAHIFKNFGEERYSKRIARTIIKHRAMRPIETTSALADIVRSATPGYQKQKTLARIFQALRIAVNGELDVLESSIRDAIDLLAPKGRIVVISYHSLEDRIVKNTFRELVKGCICPPQFPKCVCGKLPTIKSVNKKVITPTKDEISVNPRSRSAKLRCAEKI